MLQKTLTRAFVVAGSLATVISLASQANAAVLSLSQGSSVKLADLVGSGATYSGLTVGDKTFTGFTASATGDIVPFSQINVIALGDGTSSNYGLRFQGNLYSLPGHKSDLIIDYVVDSTTAIKSANLAGDATVVNIKSPGTPASGSTTVTDSYIPASYTTNIYAYANGNSPVNQLTASQDVGGVTTLNVQKDIALASGPDTLTAISFIDQTYANGGGGTPPPTVPEPASLGILGIAGVALVARRRAAKA